MDYVHSSAKHAAMGEQGIYKVTNDALMADVDLTNGRDQTNAESEGENLRVIKALASDTQGTYRKNLFH
ncbi:MAG: hypothetical protein ACKOE6_06700 [Flammeovirgaceae bacterium]